MSQLSVNRKVHNIRCPNTFMQYFYVLRYIRSEIYRPRFWSATCCIALTFDLCGPRCTHVIAQAQSHVSRRQVDGKADERMSRKSRLVCALSCRDASCGLSSTRHDARCAQQNSLPLSRDGRSEKKRNHEYASDGPRARPFVAGVSHPAIRGPEDRRGHPAFPTVWPAINRIAITDAHAA